MRKCSWCGKDKDYYNYNCRFHENNKKKKGDKFNKEEE